MTASYDQDLPSIYRFKLRGRLKESWTDWFGGMTIEYGFEANGKPVTTLTGWMADRSALYGVLNKVRDLGLLLLSVELVATDDE